MRKDYDLEDRLVFFAGETVIFTRSVKKDYEGSHLGGQLIRSSTAVPLNYGEALGAESAKDFIHKNGIVLKELKESRVCFKILKHIGYGESVARTKLQEECEELIRIIATRIKNARQKLNSN